MPHIQVKTIFHRVLVQKIENLLFSTLFFDFGGHFAMKKVPYFSNLFQNPLETTFKMVILTSYLAFHLKSGKIIFSKQLYHIWYETVQSS